MSNLKRVYDDSNKITDVGLSVTYRQQRMSGTLTVSGVQIPVSWVEITRFAKKSYMFVGMDKETAYACAQAKRSQYTRDFSHIDSSNLTSTTPSTYYVRECPSDIAPQHGEGGVWSVQITVNEQDVVATSNFQNDPASLFTEANGRNYDEDAGSTSLALTSATRVVAVDSSSTLEISYTCGITDYSPSAIIVQISTTGSGSGWSTVGTADGIIPVPSSEIYVRLAYGSLKSNVVYVAA